MASTTTMAARGDVLTDLLIAQLLEDDLKALSHAQAAEKLQLDQVLAASSLASGRFPKFSKRGSGPEPLDGDFAFEILTADARCTSDAAYAKSLQFNDEASIRANREYAERLDAEERKVRLNAEFARRLQEVDNGGQQDVDNIPDVQSLLGQQTVDRILGPQPDVAGAKRAREPDNSEQVQAAKRVRFNPDSPVKNEPGNDNHLSPAPAADVKPHIYVKKEEEDVKIGVHDSGSIRKRGWSDEPDQRESKRVKEEPASLNALQDKGKGKQRAREPTEDPTIQAAAESSSTATHTSSYLTCGICFEPFQETYSPISASLSANSSARVPFGLRLPCPGQHPYCISCLSSYIHSKLGVEEGGSAMTGAVFPIRCPDCPRTEWVDGIQEDIAERILGEDGMVTWYHHKLLESVTKIYCPNSKCSALVEPHEDPQQPQGQCPSCQTILCVSCRVKWHQGLNCQQYQALPAEDRSPEDQALHKLAQVHKWRRCYKCKAMVELERGCYHITCTCGAEFCYKCGNPWDKERKRCSRGSCELWDEDHLLEVNERRRFMEQQRNHFQQPQQLDPQVLLRARLLMVDPLQQQHQPVNLPPPRDKSLNWIDDPHIVSERHRFTLDMVEALTCGYCDAELYSLRDLKYHLAHVQHHRVFACCGRFFRREEDYEQHADTAPGRFGRHVHRMVT